MSHDERESSKSSGGAIIEQLQKIQVASIHTTEPIMSFELSPYHHVRIPLQEYDLQALDNNTQDSLQALYNNIQKQTIILSDI